jgi:ribosomal protein S24E
VHNSLPGKCAKKQDIVVWLRANGYLADISMGSVVLYDSIEKAKSREQMYNIDQIFNTIEQ